MLTGRVSDSPNYRIVRLDEFIASGEPLYDRLRESAFADTLNLFFPASA